MALSLRKLCRCVFQHRKDGEDDQLPVGIERLGAGDRLADLFPYLDPAIKAAALRQPGHGGQGQPGQGQLGQGQPA